MSDEQLVGDVVDLQDMSRSRMGAERIDQEADWMMESALSQLCSLVRPESGCGRQGWWREAKEGKCAVGEVGNVIRANKENNE